GKAIYDGRAPSLETLPREEALKLIKYLESQMRRAAKELEFERAAELRDQIVELRRYVLE
ncbi:MAG TPA: UvrB/UvrC motif-containing protein, partial [Ktedonobacterales bacterium]|nr:UvrB/UvrC motif-containing protein [Ktedonobacterales bacterium]